MAGAGRGRRQRPDTTAGLGGARRPGSTDADKEEERAERGRSDSTRPSPLAPHHFPLLLSNGHGRTMATDLYTHC